MTRAPIDKLVDEVVDQLAAKSPSGQLAYSTVFRAVDERIIGLPRKAQRDVLSSAVWQSVRRRLDERSAEEEVARGLPLQRDAAEV